MLHFPSPRPDKQLDIYIYYISTALRTTPIRRRGESTVLPDTGMMCRIISKYISNIYICLTVQCLNINLIPESGNVKAMVLRVMAEHSAPVVAITIFVHRR